MIKAIDNIPGTVTSRREMLYRDIKSAIENGIERFEFEGDYNYQYLPQYAKNETNGILYEMISKMFKERREEVKDLTITDIRNGIGWNIRPYTNAFATYSSKRGKDRRHVYGELHFDELEKIWADIIEKARKEKAKREARRKAALEREAKANV